MAVVGTAVIGAVAKKAGAVIAKKALKKASKEAGGKLLGRKKKSKLSFVNKFYLNLVVCISIYLAVAMTLGMIYAIVAPFASLNGSCSAVADTGTALPDGPGDGGTPDGTGGSSIGFPEKSTSSVFYPVPGGAGLISSHVGMRVVPAGTADFYGTGTYYHNGLDFASNAGTPILAMADGIVAQAGPNSIGYGSSITLHHLINGKRYSTTYGHIQGPSISVSVGQEVKGGQQIAGMGSEGNSTGPHLHFVLTQGTYTHNYSEMNRGPQNNLDPYEFLRSNGAVSTTPENIDGSPVSPDGKKPEVCGDGGMSDGMPTRWGGYENGRIPDHELQALSWAPEFRLSKSATTALEGLNADFKQKFGKNLPVVSAYKSVDEQRGNDVYGWAKVVDIDVSFKSEEYKWLDQNGSKFRFVQPIVYRQGEEAENPKRWNYVGGNASGKSKLPDGNLNDYQKYAGQKLIERGFTDSSELTCLVELWNKESEWKPSASNPASSARGIPQMMMNIHFGADWETNAQGREYLNNPNKQIDVGLDYIQGRYGTPCNAWNKWQTQSWY